jgi:uncharacterized membrane protein YjjP (DUF1212 family)
MRDISNDEKFKKLNNNACNIKKVRESDFIEVYNAIIHKEMSISQAHKKLGVSRPTFEKWLRLVFYNGFYLEGLNFIKKDDE